MKKLHLLTIGLSIILTLFIVALPLLPARALGNVVDFQNAQLQMNPDGSSTLLVTGKNLTASRVTGTIPMWVGGGIVGSAPGAQAAPAAPLPQGLFED